MINDKYSRYISFVTIVLVVLLIFPLIIIKGKENNISEVSNIETVLNKDSLTEINIDIDKNDWNWIIENAGDEEYKKCTITINNEVFYNVGIKTKGNSSLSQVKSDSTTDRFSFKLDFGEFSEGQSYHGIEKLALNNNITDTTSMKEYLSYDLYEMLDIPTPERTFTNIEVNNENWGLYLAVEVIDERYIEKFYGSLSGNLYKPEYMEMDGGGMEGGNKPNMENMPQFNPDQNGDMEGEMTSPNMQEMPEMGNPPDMENMPNESGNSQVENNLEKPVDENGELSQNQMPMAMGKMEDAKGSDLKYSDDNLDNYTGIWNGTILNKTTNSDYEKIVEVIKNLNEGNDLEKYINVEEVLKYFAVNTFLVNLDSYSGGMYHNYYLYENDGKIEILPWDLNMSFSGMGIKEASKAINFPIDNPVTGNLEDAPLIGKLLEIDEYREIYHNYLKEIIEKYINTGLYKESILNADELIDEYIKIDSTAFFTYDEYKLSINELYTFCEDRTASIEKQLSGEESSREYGNVETTLNLTALGGQDSMMGGKNMEKPNGNNNGKFPQINNETKEENVDKQVKSLNNMGINLIGIGVISIIILIFGYIFVYRYKRKKK